MREEGKIHYNARYETLRAVCKYGSFSAAAAALSLTPSAVAQQIRSLEDELGVTLFQKTGKQLQPTKESELLVSYVEKIDTLCERMQGDLHSVQQQLRHVTVGVTSTVESGMLSGVLDACRDDIDGIQITVVSATAAELRDRLLTGALDVAVADGEIPDETISSVILDTDHLAVIVTPNSKYAAAGMITIKELEKERLILRPRGTGTRDLFEAKLNSVGKRVEDLNVMMEVENVSTIKKLVASNYGISVLSSRVCEKDVAQGTLAAVPLCDMNMIRTTSVFYRNDFRHDLLIAKIRALYAAIRGDTL